MPELHFLDDSDAQTFRDMVSWWRKSGPSKGRAVSQAGRTADDSYHHQAPEVYVAKVPGSGIPGLTTTETGTGSDVGTGSGTGSGTGTGTADDCTGAGDYPGSAVCQIYKLNDGECKLEIVDGLTKPVYNLSRNRITTSYVRVTRDKFGRWYVDCPCADEDTGTGTGTCPGFSGNVAVVTSVVRVGDSIVAARSLFEYEAGVLCDVSSLASQTIEDICNCGTGTGTGTAGGCEEFFCFYIWNGSSWDLYDGTECTSRGGTCSPPTESGSFINEVANGTCGC